MTGGCRTGERFLRRARRRAAPRRLAGRRALVRRRAVLRVHVMNAYDEAENIICDVVRYPSCGVTTRRSSSPPPCTAGRLTRSAVACRRRNWTIAGLNFRARTNAATAVRIATATRSTWPRRGRLRRAQVRLATGVSVVHDFGAGRFAGEPVFVPSAGDTAEDAGWLMAFVTTPPATRAISCSSTPPIRRARRSRRSPCRNGCRSAFTETGSTMQSSPDHFAPRFGPLYRSLIVSVALR